jgi:hypothetical protein
MWVAEAVLGGQRLEHLAIKTVDATPGGQPQVSRAVDHEPQNLVAGQAVRRGIDAHI